MIADLRTLAVLEAPTEAETVFGGRPKAWTQLAALWIDLRPGGHREIESGGRRLLIEKASAIARKLPGAGPGQRLKAGGEPWRVVAVADGQRGRMTLSLERIWP
jgi:hypothetical protein